MITPEQTVPEEPIAVPWESCITIGKWWGYHFDDTYKPVRQLVHMLIDVVAKGGNLALNVGPQPDGRLPPPAVERMNALGAWLKVNGEAIYETRPLPPQFPASSAARCASPCPSRAVSRIPRQSCGFL